MSLMDNAVRRRSGSSFRRSLGYAAAVVAAAVAFAFTPVSAGAQTLNVGVRAGPLSMDPHFSNIGNHAEAMKNIFDTLVWAGDNLEIEPRLAESWTTVDDNTWEFRLRQGVKFHDGSDFTADDVVFSIKRIPQASGPSSPTTQNVRRVVDAVAVDPYTVRVTTNGPAPLLLNDFNRLFIVSHKAAADYSTRETAEGGFNSGKATIGTGPYKFVSWTPKDQLVVERFDDYWGGPQPWERVVFREVANDASRVAQLKAGQLDLIVRVPAADVATLRNDPALKVETTNTIYVFNVEFDLHEKTPHVSARDGSALDRNPFLDRRVREAVSLAIDREAIVEIAMEGLGAVANQFVPPSIFGYNDKLPPLETDIGRARELLSEAGYADGFRVSMAFTNDRLPGDREVGTAIAQMLARVGIDVAADAQPVATFLPRRNAGEFSMSMMGMGSPSGEALLGLVAFVNTRDTDKQLGTFNWSGYSSPEIDRIVSEGGGELDTGKRQAMLGEAMAIMARDLSHVPVAIIGSAWAMRADKVSFTPRADEDTIAMNMKPVE